LSDAGPRPPLAASPPPSLADLARAWIAVGTQSVGGATSTVYLMRSLLVERTGWIGRREFTETYALATLSPGIHLVALAALLGHRLAGLPGLVISVSGMMVPAAALTVLLSVAVGSVGQHPLTEAALAGIAPVTAGMTAGLAAVTGRAAMRGGRRAPIELVLVLAAFAVLVRSPGAAVLVVAAAGLAGALLLAGSSPRPDAEGS
jgi:chromate transporter